MVTDLQLQTDESQTDYTAIDDDEAVAVVTPILLLIAPEGSLVDDPRVRNISEGTLLEKLTLAKTVEYAVVVLTIIELQLVVVDITTIWPYSPVKMLENAPGGKYSTLFYLYGRQLDTILPDMLMQDLIKTQSATDKVRSSYDAVFESLQQDALFQDSRQRFGSSLDAEDD